MSNPPECSNAVSQPTKRILNKQWKSIRFFFDQRAFESKLGRILNAASAHEANFLPHGDHQYQLLWTQAESLCRDLASQWNLDLELLKARLPGVEKLTKMSSPRPSRHYAPIIFFGLIATPLAIFVAGVMAGLFNVGFHLVGGR
jgi:hypothetical protein